MKIEIRAAREEDLDAVADLLRQLGYPVTSGEITSCFAETLRSRQADIFVAEVSGSAVAGMISLVRFPALRLNGFQVCIEEMVVDSAHRGMGIGGRLVRFAEAYAREKGAVMLEVLSNRKRESFHRKFYEKNGFVLSNHAVLRMELRHGRKTID
jgi:predicted N-acetyltransferase YhbS